MKSKNDISLSFIIFRLCRMIAKNYFILFIFLLSEQEVFKIKNNNIFVLSYPNIAKQIEYKGYTDDIDDEDDIILTQKKETIFPSNNSFKFKETSSANSIVNDDSKIKSKSKSKMNSFYDKYLNNNNKETNKKDYIKKSNDSAINEDEINFLQVKSRSKTGNKSKNRLSTFLHSKKQILDSISDEKITGIPFNLDGINANVKDPSLQIQGIADINKKIEAEERDLKYKAKLMLELQNKVFKTSKAERFEKEYSYDKASNDFDNGDDFVAYLGYLGDTVNKYS